jgi:hypothetical protein
MLSIDMPGMHPKDHIIPPFPFPCPIAKPLYCVLTSESFSTVILSLLSSAETASSGILALHPSVSLGHHCGLIQHT